MIKGRYGDSGAAIDPRTPAQPLAIAPGKRTLTESMPAPTAGVVQRKALPGAATSTPGASPLPSASPSRLLSLFSPHVAGRRDPEQPVQRQDAPPAASGGGRALPGAVRGKMETAFGSDFSGVRIHEGPEAGAMGAVAYTQGAHIHFAPGAYDPDSQPGQELLGHELAHVVQQAQGRVAAGAQAKGAINSDAALEREADELGARAARGQPAVSGGGLPGVGPGAGGVVQRKTGGEMIGFFSGKQKELARTTENDYVTKCVAGYVAAQAKTEVSESTSPATVLGGTDWKTVDIPDELCALIESFPAHYLPTNVKVWKDLFDRIGSKRGKLSAPDAKDVDLSPAHSPGGGVTESRGKILGNAEKAVSKVATAGDLTSPEQALYNQIMRAKITMNIPLDKLFNFRSPQLLNGFEVGEKYGGGSSNIQGGLEQERRDAEQTHFGIGQDATGRVRPRYAALNFKGHPTGAAARNDYGLSYLMLSDALKQSCTITIGDSFNTPTARDWGRQVKFGSVFPFSANGVKALVKTIFALQQADNSDMDTITGDGAYHPDDNYLEVQIHDDVDLRTGVDEIWVSKLEMAIFAVKLPTVTKLIETITGGAFQLVE